MWNVLKDQVISSSHKFIPTFKVLNTHLELRGINLYQSDNVRNLVKENTKCGKMYHN